MTLGHDEAAGVALTEVDRLGARLATAGWSRAARTQLAALAVRAGRLDDARTLLAASVEAIEGTQLSSLTMSFALVADAQLALAEGDPQRAATALGAAEGLRHRAGLRAWPLARQTEDDLTARVAGRSDRETYAAAFAAGAALHVHDALALVGRRIPGLRTAWIG